MYLILGKVISEGVLYVLFFRVGGLVHTMVWDQTGERLAVLLQGWFKVYHYIDGKK